MVRETTVSTNGKDFKKILLKAFVTVIRQVSIFALFSAFALISFREIVFSPGVIGRVGEWGIPPFSGQVKQMFEAKQYTWNPVADFGGFSVAPAGFYYTLFLSFLASLGMDGGAISKFICIFAMTLAGYSAFHLCRQMEFRASSSIVSSIFYMMTPVVFDRLVFGHVAIVLDYALRPLILILFRNSVEGKHRFKSLLLTCILVSIATIATADILLTSATLLLFCIIYSLYERRLYGFKELIVVLSTTLFTQSYWLVIFHLLSSPIITYYFAQIPLKFFTVWSPSPSLTLRLLGFQAAFMYKAARGWDLWQALSFLPAILAFTCLLLKPNDKRGIFFGVLTVVGISLSSGAKGLLGSAYPWLVANVPIFATVRDNSKWIGIACLGYAVLLGLSSECLYQRLKQGLERLLSISIMCQLKGGITASIRLPISKRAQTTSLFLIFLVINSAVFVYAWPFFTGNFGGQMHTYDYGRKYKDLWRWLSNDPEDFRVLLLPAPYPTIYLDQEQLTRGAYDVISRAPGKPALYTGHHGQFFLWFLFKTLYENRTEYLGKLLGLANVKYIVLDTNKRTTSTDSYWVASYFPEMRFTNEKLLSTLRQQKDIELVYTEDSILVFKNTNYLPHIFPVSQVGLVAGDLGALVSMSYMEKLELENLGSIFLNQLSEDDLMVLSSYPDVKIIIQEGHFLDLVLSVVPRRYVLNPLEYVTELSDCPDRGWSRFQWIWYDWYYQLPLEFSALTFVRSNLNVSHFVEKTGNHNIYLKLYFGPSASSIKVYSDDLEIGKIVTKTLSDVGFRWVSLGSVRLNSGDHKLVLESAEGENGVAKVAVVPEDTITEGFEIVTELMRHKQVILISELNWEPPTYTYSQTGNDLMESWQKYGVIDRIPRGEPYFIKFENDTLILTLYFQHDGKVSEVLHAGGQLMDPPIDLRSYQYFELNYEVDDPMVQTIQSILYIDYDGDGKTDLSFRVYPGQRFVPPYWDSANNVYEMWVPSSNPALANQKLEANVFKVLRDFFPEKERYDLIGIRFCFEKVKGFDASGANSKNFTFYVKDVQLQGSAWYPLEIGVSASHGSVLSTATYVPLNHSLYIPKEGFYKISLSGSADSRVSEVKVVINNSEFKASLSPLRAGFRWYEIGEVYLPRGLSNMYFNASGNDIVYLDQFLVTESLNSSAVPLSVDFSYHKINPTKYLISAQASQPFFMVFSERHHNLWKIYIEGESQIQSYPAYEFANCFFINRTGDLEITLEFEGQTLYEVAKYVSSSSLVILLLAVLTPTRLLKFFPRRIKKLRRN